MLITIFIFIIVCVGVTATYLFSKDVEQRDWIYATLDTGLIAGCVLAIVLLTKIY